MRRCGQIALIAYWLIAVAGPVFAHTKSTSYSNWQISGNVVYLSFTIPIAESARLRDSDAPQPTDERLETYLAQHLGVDAGGRSCALSSPAKPTKATAQFRRYELQFRCDSADDIALHSSAFVDLVPSHVSLAQIQAGNGRSVQQLFTKDNQVVKVTGSESALRGAGFLQYVLMGIAHIFTGVDHIAFLIGLVLISRSLRDLVYVVTGFTVGHSTTLALAVTGIIRPHAEFIDALVALTIAMIGAENIAVASRRPITVAVALGGALLFAFLASSLHFGILPPLLLLGATLFASNYLVLAGYLSNAARLRIVVTIVFGLIHGFGFAADLLELHLPPDRLLSILFGFNVGVETGQLAIVMLALALVVLLGRAKLALPRPIVVDVCSAALVGLGTFWFVTRTYA